MSGTAEPLPAFMDSVRAETLDGPGGVQVVSIPVPDVEPGLVLVRVEAAGVTLPEVLKSRGLYQDRPELPFTLGSEFAGQVVRSHDPAFPEGARVAGTVRTGAFAEYVSATPESLWVLPDDISFEVGASLPINGMTALYTLRDRGRLVAGEAVLVRGAAGGVGLATLQLARALGAATVVAVASTEAKRASALDNGAHLAIPVGLTAVEMRELGVPPIDLVVDPVGGDDAIEFVRLLRGRGRYAIVGFSSGTIPTIAFNRLLLRDVDLVGVYLGLARQQGYHSGDETWGRLCAHVRDGSLRTVVDGVLPMREARSALEKVEARESIGKILLTPTRRT